MENTYFCRKNREQSMGAFPKGIKLYRKLRYRKGHGIHSPFVYNLITKVIEEKSPYYIFEEIETFRTTVLNRKDAFSLYTQKEAQSPKYGALLFRLVNFFKCRSVVEIGSSTGIMSLYLASAHSNCRFVFLENRAEITTLFQTFLKNKSFENFQTESGVYINKLPKLLSSIQTIGIIFVNKIEDESDLEEIIALCLSHAGNESILIIDNIHKNKRRNDLWKNLKRNPKVRVTLDLYSLGIVFFKENLHIQHYKTHFDDGKKQSIHKNRRQRINLFGRRKTGPKNPHSS